MSALTLSRNNNCLVFKGFLTRNFISEEIITQANALIAKDDVFIDLSAVSQVDTAGLAFLLLLIEEANKSQYKLAFQHLPHDLVKLTKLSAVDSFLSVA